MKEWDDKKNHFNYCYCFRDLDLSSGVTTSFMFYSCQNIFEIACAKSEKTCEWCHFKEQKIIRRRWWEIMRARRVRKPKLHVRLWKKKKKRLMFPLSYKLHITISTKTSKIQNIRAFQDIYWDIENFYINITLTETLFQMPYYTKFHKEILSNKQILEDTETLALTKECNAIIQNIFPS